MIVGRNHYVETPMRSLPLDLLRPIVENLANDSRSLLTVSLASPQLRVEAQRILFRAVAPVRQVHHIRFLTTVTSSNLLASLVDEYRRFNLLGMERQEDPLWGLTCRGLQAMINLKILRFRPCIDQPSAEILYGCTFQLEVFEWTGLDDEELILEFLQTQPQLHSLSVFWKRPDLDTSGICPRLQVLHGDRSTINAFLPGRRLTSLQWTPTEKGLLNDSIDHLSEEFQHIRFLSFGGYLGRPRLDLLIRHLRAVEVLEFIGLESLTVPVGLKKISP